jgi:hypothetical protein
MLDLELMIIWRYFYLAYANILIITSYDLSMTKSKTRDF